MAGKPVQVRLLDLLTAACDLGPVRWTANRACRNKALVRRAEVVDAVAGAVVAHYRERRWEAAVAARQAAVYQKVHFRQRIRALGRRLEEDADASDARRRELEAVIARFRVLQKELARREEPLEIIGHLARYYADDMAADFNPAFFVAFRTVARRIFPNFVRSIRASGETPDTIDRIRRLMGTEPVVLLPNHVSNADHVPICFAVDAFRGRQPRIAAGANLFRGVSRQVLPRMNAYKIRREHIGEGSFWLQDIKWFHNPVYRRAHTEYLRYGWDRNEPFLFYIEGTRSRDGTIGRPKMGIMEDLARYVADTGRAVHLVPVSLSYTVVPEDEEIAASRAGRNISKKDLVAQLVAMDRAYRDDHPAPVHVRFADPVRLEPGRCDARDAAGRVMEKIRAGVVPTPTSALAAAITACQRAGDPDPVFSPAEARAVAADRFPDVSGDDLERALDLFHRRGFVAAGTGPGDPWRVTDEPLVCQYANRV